MQGSVIVSHCGINAAAVWNATLVVKSLQGSALIGFHILTSCTNDDDLPQNISAMFRDANAQHMLHISDVYTTCMIQLTGFRLLEKTQRVLFTRTGDSV